MGVVLAHFFIAALTVAAALASPALPWHLGPLLLGLAALQRRWPRGEWTRLGLAAVWAPAIDGALGGVVLAAAILALAPSRRALPWAVLAVFLVLAAKQTIAAGVLPQAADAVPWLIVTGVVIAGAVALRSPGVAVPGALAVAGLIVVARLGAAFALPGPERLRAAERIGAVPLMYLDLLEDPRLRLELVAAAPDRDEAALAVGWERALDAGWRPRRAEGVVVEVARALEARGRGGEALRLLARHPREGDVDWTRSLLERLQGAPVRWRGAVRAPALPGTVALDLPFPTNGWRSVEFTAVAALSVLTVHGEGTSFEGAPELAVWLDADPPRRWRVDGPATLRIEGPVAPGPHRLSLLFEDDRVGPGGDRNILLTALSGE